MNIGASTAVTSQVNPSQQLNGSQAIAAANEKKHQHTASTESKQQVAPAAPAPGVNSNGQTVGQLISIKA